MFVGHALLAFALTVLVAQWRDWPAERALAAGIGVGAFAALPDIDVVYALVAVDPTALFAGFTIQPGAFWDGANQAHRGATHSLVVSAFAGAAFGLWALGVADDGTIGASRREQAAGTAAVTVLVTLVATSTAISGFVGGFVMIAFVLVGVGLATLARSRLALSPRVIGVGAVAGLASHPFGDVATGSPPPLLYPFDGAVLTERVLFSSDPTLHLLGVFGLELAVVALAVAVIARAYGFNVTTLVDRRAMLGALYGVGAVMMAPPTIDVSYHFVFSVLAVGAVVGSSHSLGWERYTPRNVSRRLAGDVEAALTTIATALAAVAVAVVSYGVVYLLL
jgi:membrane-bound metal-dependent hydrolase YbcI (DUF457 family)